MQLDYIAEGKSSNWVLHWAPQVKTTVKTSLLEFFNLCVSHIHSVITPCEHFHPFLQPVCRSHTPIHDTWGAASSLRAASCHREAASSCSYNHSCFGLTRTNETLLIKAHAHVVAKLYVLQNSMQLENTLAC